MTAVHQLIPTFAPRSAVGNHTLQVRRVLHDMGLESQIFVVDAWREVADLARPYRDLTGGPDTWLLYQASTGSAMAEWLTGRPEPKLVNYHNITPASCFAPWEPHVAVELQAGRRQLAELAPLTTLAIADSAFNETELRSLGYPRTTVVPILLDTTAFEHAVDAKALAHLRRQSDGGTAWLFVGRLAPNKAQHHLVEALWVYRRVYDPRARLRLVGGSSSAAYAAALHELVRALELEDAVDLAGDVSDAELAAHYRAADVFVSASEHEGFCVPLLEAMHHDVPAIAYGSTAVPETLGDGGLCLASKTATTLAAAVDRVVSDTSLREALVAAGRRRLAEFDLATNATRFADAVSSVVDP